MPSERRRVLIVGVGSAGAAPALRHAEAEVVLIDGRNHHTVPSALRAIKFKTINRFAREFRG
jgi:NADH dehydrogenase FAD-containing subunit